MDDSAEPGFLDRLRARYEPFEHFIRAFPHFRNCNGNLCAAGLAYYTLVALFPLLMVGFALGGFALSRHPELLGTLEERIRSWVSPELGGQVVRLMNSAIAARTSLRVIGLVVAAWMIVTTTGLSVLGHRKPLIATLKLVDIPDFSLLNWFFRVVSVLASFLVSWLVFSSVIVRLPRESVGEPRRQRTIRAACGRHFS